jgi:hypothetical protein
MGHLPLKLIAYNRPQIEAIIHAEHVHNYARLGDRLTTDITEDITTVTRVTCHSLITAFDRDRIDKEGVFKT